MIDRRGYGEIDALSQTPGDEAQSDAASSESDSGAVIGEAGAEPRDNRIAQWFRDWRKPVRHWLSRRASVPAAELDDLAQEVFVRLLRYSGKTTVENPLGYLLRIASNVASEWRERARVSKPHEQEWLDDLLIESEQEPENSVCQARTDANVQSEVDKLPFRQRQVLLLRVNEGLTYKQIAERMELSPRAVLRDLSRAYSQLRMRLDPEDLK
ncbi:RNA polymerase sigma factor [Steroidobacter sp. S1-65]|uniref:RNA polymerase sigma factor n=1 Tax=Steroidobacter gossypii TaxID=2805490 RepID=A0ABS1X608_9GAMM|nr:RNA polymerase sigma factor [Steroidobacter gossypii]MBM0108650.1 RNA polymerase sigma factor [Steroidobacter gossypii]